MSKEVDENSIVITKEEYERLTNTKELENKIRQDMLNELYTAIWRAPVRLATHKVMLFNFVEGIANGHGLSVEEKVNERFRENAIQFKGYLQDIVRYANIHIDILNEQYDIKNIER